MEEKDTRKQSWFIILGLVICCVIALILIAGISQDRSKFRTQNNTLKNEMDKLRTQTVDLKEALIYSKEYYISQEITIKNNLEITTKELEKLKQRMENVNNKNDLLKRDVELYIKSRYRRVSKIIARTIAENVINKSRDHNISPELIVGIIEVESSFNPLSVSNLKTDPARGLMQVRPDFWGNKIGLKNRFDLHDIDTGIEFGIKVFKIHLEECKGNISKALYCYVGKDKKYVSDVYYAMGKFVTFRSTVNEQVDYVNGKNKEKKVEVEVEKVNEPK